MAAMTPDSNQYRPHVPPSDAPEPGSPDPPVRNRTRPAQAFRRGSGYRGLPASRSPATRWNASESRFAGHVTAVTLRAGRRPVRRRRSARTAPAPSPRSPEVRVGGDHVAVGGVGLGRARGIRPGTRRARPSSVSASHDVPVKCWSHSRGSSTSMFRPPHQSSMTRTDRRVVGLRRPPEGDAFERGRGSVSSLSRVTPSLWSSALDRAGARAPAGRERLPRTARPGRTARTSPSR